MSKDSLIDNLLGIPPIQIGRNPLLVPRTRSSRISCRAFDRELRVQRGTRIIELLVVLDSEVRK